MAPANKKAGKKPDQIQKTKTQQTNTRNDVTVKFGKPVVQVPFKRIKFFVSLFVLMFLVMAFLSFDLLITAVRIRSHLGIFFNMISSGDGEVLPSLLALPVFAFFCLNMALFFFVYKIFAKSKSPGANKILFLLILAGVGMVVGTLIAIFATLGHVYGASKHIEDGIISAMEKYAVNSFYKKQVDQLQIEFQCCGSTRYEDWYNISWVEKALSTDSGYRHANRTVNFQLPPSEGVVTTTPAGMCSASAASRGIASPEERRPPRRRRRLSHGVTTLMYAAQQGDVDRVRNLIRSQPHSLFDQDRTGKTTLHYCCTSDSNHAAQVADFVTMAAPELVEARDEDGFTPLHLAVIAGNTQLVTFLLANGADVTAVDNEKHTVVHWATVCGETTALRAVLAAGAPVSTPDVHGGYPLHYAAQMCGGEKDSHLGIQVLHTLLAHKDINVSVEDGDKRQPLLWAASAGSAKAILALVRAGAIVESSDRDGLTALHCAASRGHTDCLDTLLTLCGASPDVIDSNGCTALHYAVTLGHADATALLLAHGADPNRQDRKGRSPAHCGCAKGQFETVKLIGGRGANLWMRNARGDLPLQEAAASGRRELVSWLLSMRPSQVNARNNDGRTPLHMAALNDNVDMCKILLDSGASINPILRTSKNVFMTPLDCALQRGFRSTAKYLQLQGGVPASRLADVQTTSSLSLQIRDDVTFWGDSSSDSNEEKRKVQKRKITFRNRKQKKKSESESDVAKVASSKEAESSGKRTTTTVTTATNTSASILESPAKKTGSSRIDYSNEIVINGKTEINIHHSKEITLENAGEVAIDTSETITVPSATKSSANNDKRPRSAKFSSKLSKEKSSSDKEATISRPSSATAAKATAELDQSPSMLGHSTGTSDDTMDTVIDTYKQKAEEMRQSSKEKVVELPEVSNTSDEVEGPNEILVEASVHPEPTMKVANVEHDKGMAEAAMKKATAEPTTKMVNVEDEEVITTKKDAVEDQKEKLDEATIVPNTSTTIAQQIKVDAGEKTLYQEDRKLEIQSDGSVKQCTRVTSPTKDVASAEDQTTDANAAIEALTKVAVVNQDDATISKEASDSKAPVSKVIGKPKQTKSKKLSEQPALVRVLKPDEIIDDVAQQLDIEDDSSDSTEVAGKTHKSFKVLNDKEAKELQNKEDRKTRSKSDDTKFKKDAAKRRRGGSKIPTPTFQTPLSKSERQLDRMLEHERRVQSVVDARVPSLPNIHETSRDRFFKDQTRPDSNLSAPILPSVYSDNERGSGSDLEDDPRSSPTKRKKVKKRPKTRRRESRSAGSDYESSNLIDSGFEPSPRSSRIPKWKNMSDRGVNMTSVTRSIQTNIRRYHLERKIFQHLLDLKRSQIRAGQHNEAVLVKRAIDYYNQSCSSTVGAGRYVSQDFTFKSFEKFLYDSLRKLQKIDVAYLKGLPDTSENVNPLLCTQSTHRCMHATHAYTGIPCAAYLPKIDHHSIPKIGFPNSTTCKPGTAGFLPSIGGGTKKAVTLELSHGNDKQVISLPTNKLDQNKRYYVTFTVKGHDGQSSEENGSTNGHVHAKSD